MDFELKSLSVVQAAALAVDALVVLVPESDPKAEGALGQLIAQAIAHKDLDNGPGQLVSAYRPAGIKAARLVLVRAGDGSAAAVRKAVAGATASLKHPGVQKLGLITSLLALGEDAVRAAVVALADASYTYTTTKPSAKPRHLSKVLVGVADASAVRAGFEAGRATVAGVEFAKEWANRPGNHATPTLLADAAKQLAKKPGIRVDVLGPKQVAALGMGAFLAVAQGSEEPCASS